MGTPFAVVTESRQQTADRVYPLRFKVTRERQLAMYSVVTY